MRKALLSLALGLVASCATSSILEDVPASADPPVADTKRFYHPNGEQLRQESRVLEYPDGRVERHGKAAEWYADGTPKSEEFYEHDRPAGVWKSWYEDGTQRSEVDFGDGIQPAAMRFWHPSGQIAGEGMGIAGVKDGLWTYWNEDGSRARSGAYLSSVREGAWTFWYQGGGKRAEGSYSKGVRIGEWRLWDEEGELVIRQAAGDFRRQ